jgi:hypothetical protein
VPAIYAGGAAQPIFAITGGPVLITGILEYLDTELTLATQTHVMIGAVIMDDALAAIAPAGVGTVVVSPLMDAARVVVAALTAPMPSYLALVALALTYGVAAGPGQNITWGFAGVDMAAGELISLHVMYRKLAPASLIA